MNNHYQNAINGLTELGRLTGGGSEISAVGTIQVQATLAVAKETAALRKAQDLGNLIAYAQLCKEDRDGARYFAAKSLVHKALASVPGLQDDDEDDF